MKSLTALQNILVGMQSIKIVDSFELTAAKAINYSQPLKLEKIRKTFNSDILHHPRLINMAGRL